MLFNLLCLATLSVTGDEAKACLNDLEKSEQECREQIRHLVDLNANKGTPLQCERQIHRPIDIPQYVKTNAAIALRKLLFAYGMTATIAASIPSQALSFILSVPYILNNSDRIGYSAAIERAFQVCVPANLLFLSLLGLNGGIAAQMRVHQLDEYIAKHPQ